MTVTERPSPQTAGRFSLRKILRFLKKSAPVTAAIAVWAGAFNFLPGFVTTDDTVAKYLVSTLLALCAALTVAVIGNEDVALPAIVEDGDVMRSSPVDLDVISKEIANAAEEIDGGASGWCHYMGTYSQQQHPSALSTAYALRSLMLTGYRAPSIDIGATCAWISSKANADGGWSAQSQGRISRTEVTSFIAGTIARIHGRTRDVVAAVEFIEETISSGSDPLLTSDTYVVAVLLQEAGHLGLSSHTSKDIVNRLIGGAVTVSESQCYWTEKLEHHGRGSASTALTAHTVLALQAYALLGLPLPYDFQRVLNGALDWLSDAALHNEVTKLVRYPAVGVEEVNVPRHFTSALVALALCQAGYTSSPAAQIAIEESWNYFRNGLWLWDSGDAPTYITFYGLSAAIAGRLT